MHEKICFFVFLLQFYGEILPMVYMYLPNKNQNTYGRAFQALSELEVSETYILIKEIIFKIH